MGNGYKQVTHNYNWLIKIYKMFHLTNNFKCK